MDKVGHDLDLPTIEVEFAWFAVGGSIRLARFPRLRARDATSGMVSVVEMVSPSSSNSSSVMRAGSPSKVRIGEHAGGGTGVVKNVEPQLAVIVAKAGAASDNLFEFAH